MTSPPRPSSPSTSHANGLFSQICLTQVLLSQTGTASDDAVSLSLPSSLVKKRSIECSRFQTPGDLHMHRLRKETDEELLLQIDTSRRKKIVRDLVTQMFAIDPKPNSTFASVVANKLVRKYPFMKDIVQRCLDSVHNVWSNFFYFAA